MEKELPEYIALDDTWGKDAFWTQVDECLEAAQAVYGQYPDLVTQWALARAYFARFHQSVANGDTVDVQAGNN